MRWAALRPDPAKRRAPASAFDRATRSASAFRPLILPPVASAAINAACAALEASAKHHCAAILADPYGDIRRWSAEAPSSRNPTVEA